MFKWSLSEDTNSRTQKRETRLTSLSPPSLFFFALQLKIPDSVSDEKALYLSDVLPTSYHAVVDTEGEFCLFDEKRRSETDRPLFDSLVGEGDIVGVWGAGPIGQCSIKWALLKGAKKVVVIDLVQVRLIERDVEDVSFDELTFLSFLFYSQDRIDFAIKESGSDKVVGVNASGGKNVVEEILKLYPDGLGSSFPSASPGVSLTDLTSHPTRRRPRLRNFP